MTDINRLIASIKRRSAHAKDFGDDVTFVKLEDLDALVATIEKSKEASGCPAGVDLQDWVKQLAAENAGLKQQEPKAWYIRMTDEVTTDSDEAKMWRGVPLVMAGIDTPATDRIVAGIKADGVSEFIGRLQQFVDEGDFVGDEVAVIVGAIDCGKEFCEQLREGADK
ncbi:TPA: hypothetical protein ACXNLE_002978 [Klebsiella aerogenes]